MKIESIKIKNFRSYKEETIIRFDNLTVLVGRNDIGKSTILEALDIFFNDGGGIIKIDKSDLNIQAARNGDSETVISVCFSELPESIIIDSAVQTTFGRHYPQVSHTRFYPAVVRIWRYGRMNLISAISVISAQWIHFLFSEPPLRKCVNQC